MAIAARARRAAPPRAIASRSGFWNRLLHRPRNRTGDRRGAAASLRLRASGISERSRTAVIPDDVMREVSGSLESDDQTLLRESINYAENSVGHLMS